MTRVATSKILELLYVNLMGPVQVASVGGKNYISVCVDDFLRYTQVDAFKRLCVKLKNEKESNISNIVRIHSDHRKEFENAIYVKFCDKHGISHEFFAPKTPQRNGVVERKNRTLQEIACVMLNNKKLPMKFWVEIISTACYTINHVYRENTI